MAEILLVRHAQSFANKRDFAAFGNLESPLTELGIEQAQGLKELFREEFGICTATYDKPVVASEYTRPQQTAQSAGFQQIDILPLINESEVDREVSIGIDVVNRHRQERWVPGETKERVTQLLDGVRSGEIDYEIFFTHGMFIAGFLLECSGRMIEVDAPFTERRGYVPLQASVTKVEL